MKIPLCATAFTVLLVLSGFSFDSLLNKTAESADRRSPSRFSPLAWFRRKAPEDDQKNVQASATRSARTDFINKNLSRGHLESAKGQYDQAKASYRRVLKKQPNHPVAHHRLAVIADRQKDYASALHHYGAALKVKPNDADLLNDVGYSYYLQHRYQESEKFLQKAVRFHPSHSRAWSNLGLLYGTQGNYDRALAMFRRSGSEADAQAKLANLFPNGRPNSRSATTGGDGYNNRTRSSQSPRSMTPQQPTGYNGRPSSNGMRVDNLGATGQFDRRQFGRDQFDRDQFDARRSPNEIARRNNQPLGHERFQSEAERQRLRGMMTTRARPGYSETIQPRSPASVPIGTQRQYDTRTPVYPGAARLRVSDPRGRSQLPSVTPRQKYPQKSNDHRFSTFTGNRRSMAEPSRGPTAAVTGINSQSSMQRTAIDYRTKSGTPAQRATFQRTTPGANPLNSMKAWPPSSSNHPARSFTNHRPMTSTSGPQGRQPQQGQGMRMRQTGVRSPVPSSIEDAFATPNVTRAARHQAKQSTAGRGIDSHHPLTPGQPSPVTDTQRAALVMGMQTGPGNMFPIVGRSSQAPQISSATSNTRYGMHRRFNTTGSPRHAGSPEPGAGTNRSGYLGIGSRISPWNQNTPQTPLQGQPGARIENNQTNSPMTAGSGQQTMAYRHSNSRHRDSRSSQTYSTQVQRHDATLNNMVNHLNYEQRSPTGFNEGQHQLTSAYGRQQYRMQTSAGNRQTQGRQGRNYSTSQRPAGQRPAGSPMGQFPTRSEPIRGYQSQPAP